MKKPKSVKYDKTCLLCNASPYREHEHPKPKSVVRRKKVVKGWAVLDDNMNIQKGEMLEDSRDCACQSMTYASVAIFETKKEAENYSNYNSKVVRVEIHLSVPLKAKGK